ncbi:DoxX family protein [Mesorhizobium sp. NPDC059054]|uniref:DoxX family protein n=1 Tax=Mesorhizobium sp. NPDC059054 TaxID=3346711 RepID=UPI00369F2792
MIDIDSLRPQFLSILRIVSALTLFQYGSGKLLGFPALERVPATFSLPWFAGVLELIGGALLLAGLFTRPAAFVLSGLMAFAYWIGHAPNSFFPILNGGNLAIVYCFVFLYLFAAGPGPWSLDAYRKPVEPATA